MASEAIFHIASAIIPCAEFYVPCTYTAPATLIHPLSSVTEERPVIGRCCGSVLKKLTISQILTIRKKIRILHILRIRDVIASNINILNSMKLFTRLRFAKFIGHCLYAREAFLSGEI